MPKPICDDCGGEGRMLCGYCNGSGEGQRDGSRCFSCWGRGEVPCACSVEGPDEMDYEDACEVQDEVRLRRRGL